MNRGLYIHIPFCKKKCDYCAFYSMPYENEKGNDIFEKYVQRLIQSMKNWASVMKKPSFDTIYIGGGTPSVLGKERLQQILSSAKSIFKIDENAEITVEVNASSASYELFCALKSAGCNRISMGLQSANDNERAVLNRLTTSNTVKNAVLDAKRAGIKNISVDVMLAIPNQTEGSLLNTLSFVKSLDVTHVSCYILSLEEGTPLYLNKENFTFPNEDETCKLYLKTVDFLEKNGFSQYEISNFSKGGAKSRHNLNYWNCGEYLGLGPSAHSFLDGKRFFYENDLNAFLNKSKPQFEGCGGDFEEYLMLRLRLKDGLDTDVFKSKFFALPDSFFKKIDELKALNLVSYKKQNSISLTKEGFLVSNEIITQLLNSIS